MKNVQLFIRSGKIRRVPPDETPVVDLELDDHWRVVEFKLEPDWQLRSRKTVDWSWRAIIEATL